LSVSSIRSALKSLPSVAAEEVVKAQASAFEDDLLGLATFPDEYVDLFLEIMSTEHLFNRKGAWHFVVKVYTDREKLSGGQLANIAEAMTANFSRFTEDKLCLTVCDFIARACPPTKALDLLDQLVNSSAKSHQVDAILVGLEVLLVNLKKDTELWKQAQQLLQRAEQKASRI
jgi:hypothetical protein